MGLIIVDEHAMIDGNNNNNVTKPNQLLINSISIQSFIDSYNIRAWSGVGFAGILRHNSHMGNQPYNQGTLKTL